MKLYGNHRSPYVRKVRIVAAEKGVDLELVTVELANPPANWAEIAPIGKIPVMEIDGRFVPDSSILVQLLEERHPSPSLRDPDWLRGRVLEELADSVAEFSVEIFYARQASDAAAEAKATARLERIYGHTDGLLARGEWPATFTIADAAWVASLGYQSFRNGHSWRTAFPHLAALADRHADRPSVAGTPPRA